jgi:hypothetical protein
MDTALIGWAAAVILVATIGRQVYTQWRRWHDRRRLEMAIRRPSLGLGRFRPL